MRPFVVAVAHLKGGSGKTTVALMLATTWHAEGHRVLVIDTDPQQTASQWAAVGAEHEQDIPAVIHVQPQAVQRAVRQHSGAYDVIVIDTPARLARETRAAMLAAGDWEGVVVVPISPGAGDRWALDDTIDVIEGARDRRPGLRAVAVANRVDRTVAARVIVDSLAETGLSVLSFSLGHRTAFVEAQIRGTGVVQHAPGARAASEARELCREVLGYRA